MSRCLFTHSQPIPTYSSPLQLPLLPAPTTLIPTLFVTLHKSCNLLVAILSCAAILFTSLFLCLYHSISLLLSYILLLSSTPHHYLPTLSTFCHKLPFFMLFSPYFYHAHPRYSLSLLSYPSTMILITPFCLLIFALENQTCCIQTHGIANKHVFYNRQPVSNETTSYPTGNWARPSMKTPLQGSENPPCRSSSN